MARHGFNIIRAFGLTALAGAFALLTGCATYAQSRTVVVEKPAGQVESGDRQADEFIGTPIMGDYDNDENLDFVLEVNDGTKVFKLEVHETAGGGNRELLENVRQKVNSMEDNGSIRVIGYYNSEYRGSTKEYGFLDLKMIAFYDEGTGKEEAYFTDPQDSQFYTDSDVTIIYAPGHHYSSVFYPRYVSPWWDTDGDGIPNRYDAWPLSYDPWYDYNFNYIPDWYDPYYVGYHPYWSYWDMNFWVGYHWYSPGYYYRGYSCNNYYNDYRTYSRLYDRRVINGRDNSGRRLERMDAKSERVWRDSYNSGADKSARVASGSPGNRTYNGYEDRTPDNRVLVDPSLTRSRTGVTSSSGDDRSRTVTSTASGDDGTFTRNRVTSDNTADNTRSRRVTTGGEKTRTSTTVTDRSRDAANVSSGRTATAASTRDRSASTTATNRVYRPTNSTSREVSSGRTTTSSSSERVYTPADRSRTSSTSSTPAATRSSSRSRSTTSPAAVSSGSSSSRSRSSAPAASSSSSSSRSRSSAPAATSRSSSSSSGSSARSSSSSSSSRSRSSSSSSSSSGSRSRK